MQAQLAIDLLKQNPTITALDFGFANVSQVQSFAGKLLCARKGLYTTVSKCFQIMVVFLHFPRNRCFAAGSWSVQQAFGYWPTACFLLIVISSLAKCLLPWSAVNL